MTLPAILGYGQVKWTAVSAVADTPSDPDVYPDAVPVTGRVTFTPSATVFLAGGGSENPVTVIATPVTYIVDETGVLRDAQNNELVTLLATDSPNVTPSNWTWLASYRLNDGLTRGSFSFKLPTGTTVDLTDVSPVSSSAGVPIIRGEKGDRATVNVGSTSTLIAGSSAVVENVGTEQNVVLDFGIPKGDQGVQGISGQPVSLLTKDQLRGVGAAAGLMVREASYKNLLTNPRGKTPDGTVRERRRNWHPNPNVELDITGWAPGGQNNSTIVRDTTRAWHGTASLKVTSNAAGAFAAVQATIVPVANIKASTKYTASGYVYVPAGQPDVTLTVFGNPSIPAAVSSAPITVKDAWVRASVTITTAPSDLTSPLGAGIVATATAAGQIFFTDGWLVEEGSALGDYFDGSITDTKTIDYAWVGTAHTSASVANSAYIEARRNWATDPNATVAPSAGKGRAGWHPRWFGSGGAGTTAYLVAADGPLGIGTYARKTWTTATTGNSSTGFQHSYDASSYFPVTAGETLTLSGFLRSNSAGKYGAAKIHWYDAAGVEVSSLWTNPPILLPPGEWTRVHITHTAPAGATQALLCIDVTSFAGDVEWVPGDTLDGTGLLIERSSVLGDYFTGSTTDAVPYIHEWTGAANASPSVQRSRHPATWVVEAPSRVFITQHSEGVRVRKLVDGGAQAGILFSGISIPAGITASMLVVIKNTGSVSTSPYGIVAGASTETTPIAPGVTAFRRVTVKPSTSSSQIVIQSGAGVAGEEFVVTGFVVVFDNYDGPFFDGDTGPATWDGVSNNSTSTLIPNSVSYWDGTAERWVNSIPGVQDDVAAIKADLAAATSVDTGHGQLVRRTSAGVVDFKSVGIINTPTAVYHATRKDYVDSKVRFPLKAMAAAYTLALADEGKLIYNNLGGTSVLTVATDATVNFPVGSVIELLRIGGPLTVAGETGVTIHAPDLSLTLRVLGSRARLVKIGANEWAIEGDTETAIAKAVAAATDLPTANTLVRRDANGHISGKGIYGTRAYMSDPQQPDAHAATRKDYVDDRDKASKRIFNIVQAGTAYTLVALDEGQALEFTNAAAVAVTVPADATLNFPVGTIIWLSQNGAGKVTASPAAGVTLRTPGGLGTRVQWSTIILRKRAANDWYLSGDLG